MDSIESELKKHLEIFADSFPMDRKTLLPNLLKEIDESGLSPNAIKILESPKHNLDISALTSFVLNGEYIEREGDTPQPIFTGEGTFIILSSHGQVIGHFENPDGRVHQKHGRGAQKTLFSYALVKGTRRLHLELDYKKGGIVRRRNWDYLKDLGPESVELFTGDAVYNTSPNQLSFNRNSDAFVVGVSGAGVRPEFIERLAGGYIQGSTEFLAGRFDTLAAETFVERIRNPQLKLMQIPSDIGNLARSH